MTINQTSLMKSSGPSLTQAEVAMEMVAQRANGDLKVSVNSSGTSVNGNQVSKTFSDNKITKDTVSFSPAATAAISNQQVALNIIQDSQSKPKGGAVSDKVQADSGIVMQQLAAQVVSPTEQDADSSQSPLGESVIGSEDPASVIAAYTAESPAERFYNSNEDPSSIPSEFFSSSEKQASYIAAFNSGSLHIQDIGSFLKSDVSSTTTFSSGGMSAKASGTNQLDLSSIKEDNVMTFDDPIAGSMVISWNNN